MKYSVITFGCRVNQADSLELEEDLRSRGDVAAAPETAVPGRPTMPTAVDTDTITGLEPPKNEG